MVRNTPGWLVVALAVGLTLPAVAVAQAPTVDEDLAAIRELVLHATYRDALARATSYLARADLDASHRAAGLEVRAIVQLALRDETGARTTLAELYARDPGHRLEDPDASPVVQSAFAHARESAAPLAVALDDRTETAPTTRGTPEVSVAVGEHGDAVQELRVSYRRAGDSRWLTALVSPDETGTATSPLAISGTAGAAYEVDYHVEALAPSGTVIARLGSADAPLHIAMPAASTSGDAHFADDEHPVVPATPGGGVETEAWFWVVMGVLVVGAGVGVGVGVAVGTTPTATSGSLDTVTLPLVSF